MAKYQGLTAYNFGDEDFVTLNGSIGATLGVSRGFIMDRLGDVRKYVLFGMRGPMVYAFLFVKSSGAHVRNENDVRAC